MPTRVEQMYQQARRRAPQAPTRPAPTPELPVDRTQFYRNREQVLNELSQFAARDVDSKPDPVPDLLSDDYIRRYKDMLVAVNGRLAASGGPGLTPIDFRLRVGNEITPYPVGSYEELILWADELGIDITAF